MTKAFFSTIAAAATLIAIPAFAAERADPAVSAPAGSRDAQQRPATRYCFQGPTTGTILQNKICRTREEWLKRGVDPIAK